jgi:hypothetical protein
VYGCVGVGDSNSTPIAPGGPFAPSGWKTDMLTKQAVMLAVVGHEGQRRVLVLNFGIEDGLSTAGISSKRRVR